VRSPVPSSPCCCASGRGRRRRPPTTTAPSASPSPAPSPHGARRRRTPPRRAQAPGPRPRAVPRTAAIGPRRAGRAPPLVRCSALLFEMHEAGTGVGTGGAPDAGVPRRPRRPTEPSRGHRPASARNVHPAERDLLDPIGSRLATSFARHPEQRRAPARSRSGRGRPRSGRRFGVVLDVGDHGVQSGFEGVGGVLGLREDEATLNRATSRTRPTSTVSTPWSRPGAGRVVRQRGHRLVRDHRDDHRPGPRPSLRRHRQGYRFHGAESASTAERRRVGDRQRLHRGRLRGVQGGLADVHAQLGERAQGPRDPGERHLPGPTDTSG
jgi:hypothetical protein